MTLAGNAETSDFHRRYFPLPRHRANLAKGELGYALIKLDREKDNVAYWRGQVRRWEQAAKGKQRTKR
jgi:hypothetical protein